MFGGIGMPEMILIAMVALLLFGKRLPEVARNMGRGITEFKKGVRGFEDDVQSDSYSRSESYSSSRPAIHQAGGEDRATTAEPFGSEATDRP